MISERFNTWVTKEHNPNLMKAPVLTEFKMVVRYIGFGKFGTKVLYLFGIVLHSTTHF